MFPRLRERWDQLAGNLSGGEQQMLALGMAFIAKPKLLMIDELSLGLAPTIVEQLLDIVRAHPRRGHDDHPRRAVGQRRADGRRRAPTSWRRARCASQGPTAELLERDDILRSVFLEGAPTASTRRTAAGAHAVASAVDARWRRSPVLEVRGLTQALRRHHAPSTTSTLHAARGRDPRPHRPERRRQDDDLRPHLRASCPPTAAASCSAASTSPTWRPTSGRALGLGRSFQDARLFPSLTVAENIARRPRAPPRRARPRRRRCSALPACASRRSDVACTVDDLIELMGLGAFRDKFVARAVDRHPPHRRPGDVRSPTTRRCCCSTSRRRGIAQRETEALGPLLQRIRDETGCALLVIEHDMPLITGLSDRSWLLELGKVLASGATERGAVGRTGGQRLSGQRPGDHQPQRQAAAPRKRASRAKAKAGA